VKEEYKKWYSPNLSGDIELLVFGHSGRPVILFPTSNGRYYQNKDSGLIDSASHLINEGKVKIYCPDSIDAVSWYNKSIHPADRAKNHAWYDKMILDEVSTLARNETGFGQVVTAGCSFGGYHAANFAFRHPWLVSHMFSMSGIFDITDEMDGFYNSDVYYNNPVDFLPHDQDPDLWKMDIVLGTAQYDVCRPFNERLSHILSQKRVDHWLDIRPNADHDWPIWREMFPAYLSRL